MSEKKHEQCLFYKKKVFKTGAVPGPDDHIHRIGRTGRAGVPGRAVTFLDSRESKEAREAVEILADFIF